MKKDEKQIYLMPYTDVWVKEFEQEKKLLLKAIGAWVEDIQHVGSTAVPGLSAKPVIDIMIGVRDLKDADEYCISKIQDLGYEYIKEFEAELPNRRFFLKNGKDGVRSHHIHLVEIGSDWWKRHLLFRDYLRKHPEISKEYEELKKALALKHANTNDYARAKTEFIRAIEALAAKENK